MTCAEESCRVFVIAAIWADGPETKDYVYIYSRVYCCSCPVCVVIFCVFVVLCGHCFFFTLDAVLLARNQYPEGPATGHLDTGFSWFPCT